MFEHKLKEMPTPNLPGRDKNKDKIKEFIDASKIGPSALIGLVH